METQKASGALYISKLIIKANILLREISILINNAIVHAFPLRMSIASSRQLPCQLLRHIATMKCPLNTLVLSKWTRTIAIYFFL